MSMHSYLASFPGCTFFGCAKERPVPGLGISKQCCFSMHIFRCGFRQKAIKFSFSV